MNWQIERNVTDRDALWRMMAATGILLLALFGLFPGWLGGLMLLVAVGLMASALLKRCYLKRWWVSRAR